MHLTALVDNAKSDLRSWKSEAGSRNSKVGTGKLEAGTRNSKVGSWKAPPSFHSEAKPITV